jgi:hypothetical protein
MERNFMAKTTIQFSEPADKMLTSMTTRLGSSKAEVIRNALALYAYLMDQLITQPAYELAIAQKADNKVVKAVVVPGLTQVVGQAKQTSGAGD